jgi:hypothetical protein
VLVLTDTVEVQAGISATGGIAQMEKDAEQQHQDLVALLANYPDSTNSDLTSVKSMFSFKHSRTNDPSVSREQFLE